jgi:hypothetical protein
LSPIERSMRVLEGVNIRRSLEASGLPIEVATAIADLCEFRPEATPSWRSCETDEPPEGQEVIVWDEGLFYLANRIGPGRWSDYERSFTLGARAMWRPLPEHPKRLPQKSE